MYIYNMIYYAPPLDLEGLRTTGEMKPLSLAQIVLIKAHIKQKEVDKARGHVRGCSPRARTTTCCSAPSPRRWWRWALPSLARR